MNRTITYPLLASAAALLLPVLVDSALKGCVLLGIAAALVLLLHRASASMRHLIWVAALVALLVLPAVSMALPQWRVLPSWMDPSALARLQGDAAPPMKGEVDSQRWAELSWLDDPFGLGESVGSGDAEGADVASKAARGPSLAARVALPTLIIWAAGALALCLRLVLSWWFLWRLGRSSEELTRGPIYELLASLRRRFGIRRRVRLVLSARRDVPMTWGIWAGHVLLPREAETWDEARLRSVLLHELAHVKRLDGAAQLLVQIACALYWFNPLVWAAAWRVRVERERACDDFVLRNGMKASAYAGHLLAVSTGYESHPLSRAGALAMAGRLKLEGRLLRVLNGKLNRSAVTRSALVLCSLAAATLLLPVAMMRGAPAPSEAAGPPRGGLGTTRPERSETDEDPPATPAAGNPAVSVQGQPLETEAEAVAALQGVNPTIRRDENGRVRSVFLANRPQVTDADLEHVKAFAKLEVLKLPDGITDAGLVHLSRLTNLTSLKLSGARVTDAGMVHLKGLTKLTRLWLDHTQITDRGLVHLKGLEQLTLLHVDRTQITDAGLEHLQTLKSLRSVGLAQTRITGAGLQYLQGLTNLLAVQLTDTRITNANLVHLNQLSVDRIRLDRTQITDEGLAHLAAVPNLRWGLHLGQTAITDAGLVHLKQTADLERLWLNDTKVTDGGLEHLKNLRDLRHLNLQGTKVSDDGMRHLTGMTNLGTLVLADTAITDGALVHFETFGELEWLYLNNTEITDAGLDHLHALKNLKSLNLQGTDVSPEGVGQLKEALPNCEIKYDGGTGSNGESQANAPAETELAPAQRSDGPEQSNETALPTRSLGTSAAAPDEAESEAIAALENLGAQFERDSNGEVTAVILRDNPRVTDADLEQLNALTNLKLLMLAGCPQITDAGLQHVKGLNNLEILFLGHATLDSQNVTDGGLVHLKDMTNLRTLVLSNTRITDAGLDNLKGLTKLDELWLLNTNVGDVGLIHLEQFKNLTNLGLQGTQVTDAGLEHLKGLTELKRLWIGNTSITDAGLEHLAELRNLNWLWLIDTGITDAGLERIKGLTTLRYLMLGSTKVTDAGLQHLKGLNLRLLDLGKTQITDSGLASLKDQTGPNILLLNETKVTDAGLKHLEKKTELETLVLSGTSITDTGLESLTGMARLRTLRLVDTKVTDAGLAHLKGLQNLRILDLKNTQVSQEGFEQLRAALPECQIEFDGGAGSDLEARAQPSAEAPVAAGERRNSPNRALSTSAAAPDEAEAEAVAALKDLGARIRLDENGKVIHVGLAKNVEAIDADLEQLKFFTQLNSLHLGPRTSDDGLEHLKGLTKLESLKLG